MVLRECMVLVGRRTDTCLLESSGRPFCWIKSAGIISRPDPESARVDTGMLYILPEMDNSNRSPFGHNMRRNYLISKHSLLGRTIPTPNSWMLSSHREPCLQSSQTPTQGYFLPPPGATASATTTSVTAWTTSTPRKQIKKPVSGSMSITLLNTGISKAINCRKRIQEPKAAIGKLNKRGKVEGHVWCSIGLRPCLIIR